MIRSLSLLFFSLLLLSLPSEGTTYTVTNTADSGPGSLRQAMTDANMNPASDIIQFNIPLSDGNYQAASGVWKISPSSPLPYITGSGLLIDGTTQTTAQGNLNPDGPEIMLYGNDNLIDYGFNIFNAHDITIRGFIISDFMYGIEMYGTSSRNNVICGNYIGTNPTASDSLGNFIGIEIIGGAKKNTVGSSNPAFRNIVSGNEHIGIRVVDADSNTIIGNYVGTDRTGNVRLGNYDGVSIEGTAKYNQIGGDSPEERNIISGNWAYGLPFIGNGVYYNRVTGNYIGTNASGNTAVPNTYGVLFDDGSSFNIVGADNSLERNIISGNSGYGVFIYNYGTHENVVEGNYIGTDANGSVAVPNANGIVIDGAPYQHYIRYNVISGNLQEGIVIHITGSNGHIITNNKIGTTAVSNQPLGNGTDGIRIGEGPKGNIIGGSPGTSNLIAYNAACGVNIMTDDVSENTIRYNSIHSNGSLGIDLYPAGPNPNDAGDLDVGANGGMNYPVIDSVSFGMYNSTIYGRLDAIIPRLCMVDVYMAYTDFTGYGEGAAYLGSCYPQNDGSWSLTLTSITEDMYFTATATDSLGNTSEFSFDYPYPDVSIESFVASGFRAYPNPFTTQFTVELSSQELLPAEIILHDALGRECLRKTITSLKTPVYAGSMSRGSYLLEVISAGKGVYHKTLIAK
jgi:parallel beta-helix repeat protein